MHPYASLWFSELKITLVKAYYIPLKVENNDVTINQNNNENFDGQKIFCQDLFVRPICFTNFFSFLYTQVYSLNKRAVYVESPSLQPEPVQTCWNSWFEIVLNQCHHDEYMQHYLEFFEREHTDAQV